MYIMSKTKLDTIMFYQIGISTWIHKQYFKKRYTGHVSSGQRNDLYIAIFRVVHPNLATDATRRWFWSSDTNMESAIMHSMSLNSQ